MIFGVDVFGGAVFAGTGQAAGTAPVISGPSSFSIPDGTLSGATIATYTATGDPSPTFSLTGTDAALLTIGSVSGFLSLNSNADFDTKPSYSFNVVATNTEGSDSIAVTILVVVCSGGINIPINGSINVPINKSINTCGSEG